MELTTVGDAAVKTGEANVKDEDDAVRVGEPTDDDVDKVTEAEGDVVSEMEGERAGDDDKVTEPALGDSVLTMVELRIS